MTIQTCNEVSLHHTKDDGMNPESLMVKDIVKTSKTFIVSFDESEQDKLIKFFDLIESLQ